MLNVVTVTTPSDVLAAKFMTGAFVVLLILIILLAEALIISLSEKKNDKKNIKRLLAP